MAKSSKQEDDRYLHLKLMEGSGMISNLVRQLEFKAVINGIHVFTYTADFAYFEPSGLGVIEEFKGYMHERHDFALRMKVCSALWPDLEFRIWTPAGPRRVYKAGKITWKYIKPRKPRNQGADSKGSDQPSA